MRRQNPLFLDCYPSLGHLILPACPIRISSSDVSGYTKKFACFGCEQGCKNKMLVVTKFSLLFFCKRQTLFFVVVRTGPMVMIFTFVNHLYYVSREFLVLKVLREDMVKKGIRYCITRDNSFPSILTRIVWLLAVTLLFKSLLYLLALTTFNSK